MNFGRWLKRKQPPTIELFYCKTSQILRLKEADLAVGKVGGRSSNEVVQSNVAIKQTDENASNVAVIVGTNNNDTKKEKLGRWW